MDNEIQCAACGARNRTGAAWCARCHAAFAVAPSADAAVDPPPASDAGSSSGNPARRRLTSWAITLVILAATAARVVASVGPDVSLGSVDPRGFRFTRIDASTGEPVRFNPCAPIHYVINPASAPEGGIEDVHAAFTKTTEASGVKFVYDGTTEEIASVDRDVYQPDRYGDRWAPLLIAWAHELPNVSDQPEEEGRERIAIGGSALVEAPDGGSVLATGMAVFDADADLQPGFGGSTWGQAMLHELGHIMGLDHVEIPNSIMNPLLGLRSAAWGEGDRAGLWELGLGSPCIRMPQPN